MATLDDKILGEKLENYCSSSEDEGGYEDASDGESSDRDRHTAGKSNNIPEQASNRSDIEKWSGSAANTGPKGVIKDWQRFKQLESEKNEDKERERLVLMKKLCITANTAAEDAKLKEQEAFDVELSELFDEDSLLAFQRQRMMEMLQKCGHQQTFGKVLSLHNGDDFLEAVDKENKLTIVVIHIYDNNSSACKTMNTCLETLAKQYAGTKFCKIFGSLTGLSKNFTLSGIPALLVYKAGNLIGNFVRVSDDLGGDDFFPSDVEGFLIEHAMLPDKSLAPHIVNIRNDTSDN